MATKAKTNTPDEATAEKGKKSKEHPLFKFFGPECESEIKPDGTMTRGAETFCAAAEGDSLPAGDWQGMAERDDVTLYRLPV